MNWFTVTALFAVLFGAATLALWPLLRLMANSFTSGLAWWQIITTPLGLLIGVYMISALAQLAPTANLNMWGWLSAGFVGYVALFAASVATMLLVGSVRAAID